MQRWDGAFLCVVDVQRRVERVRKACAQNQQVCAVFTFDRKSQRLLIVDDRVLDVQHVIELANKMFLMRRQQHVMFYVCGWIWWRGWRFHFSIGKIMGGLVI